MAVDMFKVRQIFTAVLESPDKKKQPCKRCIGQHGVTLFELLVAVLLMAIASGMVYSVLHSSIRFSEKGDTRLQEIARQHGFLELVHRQVKNACFDSKLKKVMLTADQDILRVVTRKPLLFPAAGLVLAVYRYSPDRNAVFYTEKKDYFNQDYKDEYIPDIEDMAILASYDSEIVMEYDAEQEQVIIVMDQKEYVFSPRASNIIYGQRRVF